MHTALCALPPHELQTASIIREAISKCSVRTALRLLNKDFNTIPKTGHSLPLIIDEVLNGPIMGSILHPPRRQRLLDTLAQLTQVIDGADQLPNQVGTLAALHKYGRYLNEHPHDTLV